MTVYRRFLLDRYRTDLWWALGIFGTVLVNLAFFPSLEGQAELDETLAELPPALRSLFGIEEGVSLGSAAGYLQAQVFAVMPLLFVVLGVAAGSAALGGAEEDGSLEFLLSNPISRRRIVVERLLAVATVIAGHTALFTLEMFTLSPLFGALDDVDLAGIGAACAGAGVLGLLHGTMAFAAGAFFGRRNAAIALASAVAVGGYVAQGLFAAVGSPEALRFATPWYWYLRENMAAFGPNLVSFVPGLIAAVVVGLAAIPLLERRDLRG